MLVIDDFAHHPTAVRETIAAIRQPLPGPAPVGHLRAALQHQPPQHPPGGLRARLRRRRAREPSRSPSPRQGARWRGARRPQASSTRCTAPGHRRRRRHATCDALVERVASSAQAGRRAARDEQRRFGGFIPTLLAGLKAKSVFTRPVTAAAHYFFARFSCVASSSQSRKPPRNAFALLPRRVFGGSSSMNRTLPPAQDHVVRVGRRGEQLDDVRTFRRHLRLPVRLQPRLADRVLVASSRWRMAGGPSPWERRTPFIRACCRGRCRGRGTASCGPRSCRAPAWPRR